MNRDDLKLIWICDQCRMVFVFLSDTEIHCQKSGHNHVSAYDFESGQLLKSKGTYLKQLR